MTDIVSPFAVRYEGNDADHHMVEARSLGESITGAGKLYSVVAHYVFFGEVPGRRYREEFRCYIRPAQDNCYEYWAVISAVAGEYGIHSTIYNAAISFIFQKLIDGIKEFWTRPGDTNKVVDVLAETIQEQSRRNSDVTDQLVAGLLQANKDLASLQSQLIETLPALAERSRPSGIQLVRPIGNTCRSITQFAGTDLATSINEPEAEVIRGGPEMEIDPMTTFTCNRIREINLNTGHCLLEIEGIEGNVSGVIDDPQLQFVENPYTTALNQQTGCLLMGKAVRKAGEIHRIYISDTG